MGKLERKKKLLNIINERKGATVYELASRLGVSPYTVRRYLNELSKEGLLKKVYGGATLNLGTGFEYDFYEKEKRNREVKLLIAKKAFEFLKPGITAIFDSSTTVLSLARLVKEHNLDIKVVTNSLPITRELVNAKNVEIFTLGGKLRRQNLSFVGFLTVENLNRIKVDIAFMGATGISEEGLTTVNVEEAETNVYMLKSAAKRIILADETKIGRTSFFKVASLSEVDVLITTHLVPPNRLENIRKAGVEIILV